MDDYTVYQTIWPPSGASVACCSIVVGGTFWFVFVRRMVLSACVVINDTQAAGSTFVRAPIGALNFSEKECRDDERRFIGHWIHTALRNLTNNNSLQGIPGYDLNWEDAGAYLTSIQLVIHRASLLCFVDSTMTQASRVILPSDVNGPCDQRIDMTVNGSIASAHCPRYSIVALYWDDSASTTWNPQTIIATIKFRGMQAAFPFPVGVTTL
ncbi:hypothetical protein EDB84DRAFT_1436007 [Lactarius hengduanensis]|nr:hypothetical protein EDB84DRAFT_1436007 [Lactarius hengduanensis]